LKPYSPRSQVSSTSSSSANASTTGAIASNALRSPVPLPAHAPRCASKVTRDPHSVNSIARTCGSTPPEGIPNAATFSGVSGTSNTVPSTASTRHRPARNAPGVCVSATGTATCSNTSRTGAAPSRARALAIPPEVGVSYSASKPPSHDNGSASRSNTPS
jgi:hypothetical protein